MIETSTSSTGEVTTGAGVGPGPSNAGGRPAPNQHAVGPATDHALAAAAPPAAVPPAPAPAPPAAVPPARHATEVRNPGLGTRSLDVLHGVEMTITVELGRTRLLLRDLLALRPGSIIELDRAAGSPVDVLINGTLLAHGEVVVVDDEFGVRVTDIVSGDNLQVPS